MPVPAAITVKLARTLAMLSSDQPGERRAAFAAAERIMAAAGIGWRDVAELMSAADTTPPPVATAPAPDPDDSIRVKPDGSAEIDGTRLAELVAAIHDASLVRDDWTYQFLKSMEERAAQYSTVYLSVKQMKKLTELLRRLPT